MYAPITSEIDIKTGMTLKEISTGELFTVSERMMNDPNVSGEDRWKIIPVETIDQRPLTLIYGRQELAEKYFADAEA